tara:strand:+ start:151 stop:321 length:171 start_codon:yes stop_codon:yes gene_type:complete
MINKVTKKECMDAIEYLFEEGFIEDMRSDARHYTKILLNKVANNYKLKLMWTNKND